jgi:hypothetical protein
MAEPNAAPSGEKGLGKVSTPNSSWVDPVQFDDECKGKEASRGFGRRHKFIKGV